MFGRHHEPLYAEDIEAAMAQRRYRSERHHPCGCRTRFDTLDWRSESVFTCEFHAPMLRHEAARSDASEGSADR